LLIAFAGVLSPSRAEGNRSVTLLYTAEGDKVVIGFQGQDRGNPRVIGFRNNPGPC
jgi:hypothetical protein